MKTFILGLLMISTPAFACRNSVPQSEAEKYIAAAELGQSVPGGPSCVDKLEEACLCFDAIDGWDVAAIVDEYVDDLTKPIYLSECPQGKAGCVPAGYEQYKSGRKILANDPQKVIAKIERLAQEEAAKQARDLERQKAIMELKTSCNSGIDAAVDGAPNSVAGVKSAIKLALKTCILNIIKSRSDP